MSSVASVAPVPQRPGPPTVSNVERSLIAPDEVLRSFKRRKVSYERKHAAKYDPTKKDIYTLSPDVLRVIYDKLDVPTRVSLSLTSKFFLEMSQRINTAVTDLPTPVRLHQNCKHLPCIYTNHLSSRRILLLMLKTWMPHGTTLCWICLKYTRTSASKWKVTNQFNLQGFNRIRIPALDALNLKKVKCHVDCLPASNTNLSGWLYRRPGATGGFDSKSHGAARAMLITPATDRLIEYDAGADDL
ncbi:uncharacterized protein A1O9_12502 [Exophiala aquamarina CBS 119918]|uniref:F-box domain-containing protein n=1 Tax=Exophiala aquamarina CBS 119918 TaxID=1182545 RepID=A0A072NWF6_9EURO|nr:uncharacterized protein A1O9_12502 [Exophiala aquamarina CBS 119918]KEF51353.1 hypothetical protein A1O9_12502 [Exophiala aquamarina CBS 119918]